ncbi:MAG: peptidoglycan recognition protein family protein [Telluria sp.]
MLRIDKHGHIFDSRIKLAMSPHIERGPLVRVRGIIVHQTGAASSRSSLNSYANPKANGAHFLIDRDGTVYQTASVLKQTWHVGSLRSRCIAEYRCTKVEMKSFSKFNPKAEHRKEMAKSVPGRYPANEDSIGIEIVGAVKTPNGAPPAEKGTYESVNQAQNDSLRWLVSALAMTFSVPMTEVFRHPVVSRKNPTEATSAIW